MHVYRCETCGHTVEVCTPNAQVAHVCTKGGRPAVRNLEQTEASALSR